VVNPPYGEVMWNSAVSYDLLVTQLIMYIYCTEYVLYNKHNTQF